VAPSAEVRVAVARRGIESYARGDIEGTLAVMHPEIEGYAEGPNTGTFRGTDGFLGWTAEWMEAWERFDLDLSRVEAVGERHAVAIVDQTGLGRDSGVEVDQRVAYLFEIDGEERCVHLALYLDPERAFRAARERESAPG